MAHLILHNTLFVILTEMAVEWLWNGFGMAVGRTQKHKKLKISKCLVLPKKTDPFFFFFLGGGGGGGGKGSRMLTWSFESNGWEWKLQNPFNLFHQIYIFLISSDFEWSSFSIVGAKLIIWGLLFFEDY